MTLTLGDILEIALILGERFQRGSVEDEGSSGNNQRSMRGPI